jgi:dinuclear metal center YbgI/SA1388 family protein
MELTELTAFFDTLLSSHDIKDFCPNGLQVEGRASVQKIITGVSANQALFESAAANHADVVLVHHGLFWHKQDNRPIKLMRQRLDVLFRHNMSLLAYHLPLDFHLTYGNNIQFAKKIGFAFKKIYRDKMNDIPFFFGTPHETLSGEALADRLRQRLDRNPFYLPGTANIIKKVAWCVGAASSAVCAAALHGADAYITGEVSEPAFAVAREMGIHFYGAGHHASEMFGVQALGQHAAEKFGLTHQFININNPI